MFLRITLLLFLFAETASAQYPDGTIILSSKKGLIGRVAKRITGGDQYTHSQIILGGRVYESDWPRAKVGPIGHYKRGTTNDYYVPVVPFTTQEVAQMKTKAQSMVGKRYDLRNYRNPSSRRTDGTWCSPFVGQVLNASGRFNLSFNDYYEPQNLIGAVDNSFSFYKRVQSGVGR